MILHIYYEKLFICYGFFKNFESRSHYLIFILYVYNLKKVGKSLYRFSFRKLPNRAHNGQYVFSRLNCEKHVKNIFSRRVQKRPTNVLLSVKTVALQSFSLLRVSANIFL